MLKLPIFDPLGLLSEPAEKLAKDLFGEDIEFHDPIREFILDRITEEDAGTEPDKQESTEPDTPERNVRRTIDEVSEKEEYLKFGKRVLTFSCSRCQAIAEWVANEYAPGSPKKQLECIYYIKMFDESDSGTEDYEKAKDWLERNDLKDLLYTAYLKELEVIG